MDPITSALDVRVFAALALALAAGFAGGFFFCRHTARVERLRQLQRELEEVQAEHRSYRNRVANHFGTTSQHLQELTMEFRNMYLHLTEGAHSLCGEHSTQLDSGLADRPSAPIVDAPPPLGEIARGDDAVREATDELPAADTRAVLPAEGSAARGQERRAGESRNG